MYYVNDGVYGSFNCVLYDHYIPEPSLFANVSIARWVTIDRFSTSLHIECIGRETYVVHLGSNV